LPRWLCTEGKREPQIILKTDERAIRLEPENSPPINL
jgi:hypothetical protein